MRFFKSNFLPFFIFFFFLILFIHNLLKGVYAGDSGDLITSAVAGGVAHPPGYPLFTFLGFLLTRFSFWSSPAYAVNLISAIFGALSLFLFFQFTQRITKNYLISFIAVFTIGFSYLFWFYSEIAEVFILNLFFTIILFYLAFLINEKFSFKKLFLFLFLLSLSFTNQQTIVLIYPSLFIIIFNKKILNFKFLISNYKNLLFSFLFLISGFLIYLYVPIASYFKPIINWDNVHDIPSFLRLLLRLDYGTFNAGTFSPPNIYERLVILQTYFFYILTQLTPPVIFISLLGFIYLFFKNKRFLFAFFLAFILSGPLFVVYAGFPLLGSFYLGIYERFFILSAFFIYLFFLYGLVLIFVFLKKILKRELSAQICLSVFLIIPISLFIYNYPKTNLSNVSIGDNLGFNFISYLPKNSLVILNGDTELFNTWYVHYALKKRTDLKIINLNNMYNDKFLGPLIKNYQTLHPKLKQNIIFEKVIFSLYKKYPIFSYEQISFKKNVFWIPYGLLYQMSESKISEENFKKNISHVWPIIYPSLLQFSNSKILGSYSLAEVPLIYSQSALSTGSYFYKNYNDKLMTEDWYKTALQIDPHNYKVYEVYGLYLMVVKKDCFKARDFLKKAISINPFGKNSYYFLYENQFVCLNNKPEATKTAVIFTNTFHYNFFKAFKEQIKKYKKI